MQKIAKALIEFRKVCPNIGFDAKNPHFKSRYASLAKIHSVIDPLLADHGLVVLQFPVNEGEMAGVRTMVLHESGESIEDVFMVPIGKADPQKACAAVTYARRYSLSGALSLVTEEDDDGNAAAGRREVVNGAGKSAPREKKQPGMSAETRGKLKHAAEIRAKELGDDIQGLEIIKSVASALGYANPIEMKEGEFEKVLAAVQGFEPGEVAA